ncbi:VOC family protein [Aureimonas leprariae]|uniref:Glyoxalase n=1 Tax=Plantimonas leprariae TaxID=2615207 RepID=A0A7V7PT90_9HYPH|nr:VOC family protein [Aureimonas leprariae]KAB0682915.1 glyoxalase [Aureimonas leprariae]
MEVRRIVANLAAAEPASAAAFYRDFLGLDLVMDHGWIATFVAPGVTAAPQVSVARDGGSGMPVPALSIEVDDADGFRERAVAKGIAIVRDIADEPWGVRRFFVRDPFGNLVNILSHGGG